MSGSRPSQMREVKSGWAIGVDVGGTKIAAGGVQFPEGRVLGRREVATLPQRGGDAVARDVKILVEEIFRSHSNLPVKFLGTGLGICELVDSEGNPQSAHCLPWHGPEVRAALQEFGPVVIEADVRAAARAESMFGAGRGARNFLYLTVGTGISSCLVIAGEPFAGARGAAGTMASGPFPGTGSERMPSLEAMASGPGLVASYRALGGMANSAQEVFAAAESGDGAASEVVRRGGRALGSTIGLLVNVLDPERVVLGGGLGLREGLYRDLLVDAAREHIWWEGHRQVRIVSAETGLDAGLIGAAVCGARWSGQPME